jgi:hypothetical protein
VKVPNVDPILKWQEAAVRWATLSGELDVAYRQVLVSYEQLRSENERLRSAVTAARQVERIWSSLPDDFDPPQELAEAVMAMGAGYALDMPTPETEALAHTDEIEFYRLRMNELTAEVERLQSIAGAARAVVKAWHPHWTIDTAEAFTFRIAELAAALDESPTTEATP